MNNIEKEDLRCLDAKRKFPKEPVPDEINFNQLCKMISKKTKFRETDIKEVLNEFDSAVYALMIQRKGLDFGAVHITLKWQRLMFPRYVRDGLNTEEGHWVFGFFKPAVVFDPCGKNLFLGINLNSSNKFIDSILPYFPEEIKTKEDIINLAKKEYDETCKLGKETCVDEDGFLFFPNGVKKTMKRVRFNEKFHPTYYEKKNFLIARGRTMKAWKELSEEEKSKLNYREFFLSKLKEFGYTGSLVEWLGECKSD